MPYLTPEGFAGSNAEGRVPNLPFFYLCFRAYSHYRALYGGKLLEHLMGRNVVKAESSKTLDAMYTAGLLHGSRQGSREAPTPTEEETEQVKKLVAAQSQEGAEEVMVLQRWNGKLLAEAFHLPEMEVEIERAVEQVESALEKAKKEREEKKQLEQGKGSDTESTDNKKDR